MAMKLVSEDHQLVTSLLRLNTSLPAASTSRISALYVFDAIARDAKRLVDKGVGRTASTERGKGTQAGLLAKMEAVVDSWVAGLIDDGRGGVWPEGRVSMCLYYTDNKDKTRKILDIWKKGNTFPESCIAQLQQRIADSGSGGNGAGPSKPGKCLVRDSNSLACTTVAPHYSPRRPAALTVTRRHYTRNISIPVVGASTSHHACIPFTAVADSVCSCGHHVWLENTVIARCCIGVVQSPFVP